MSTGWTPEPAHDDTPPLPYTGPYVGPAGAPAGSPAPAPYGAGVPGVVGAPPPHGALPPYAASSFGPVGGPPPRRGLSAGAIVAIVLGSFFAVSVLAAIAIPAFLSQREAAADQPGAAPAADFDWIGCADLAADAVRFSSDVEYPGNPLLTSVEDLVLFEDERADLQVPVEGEYEFIMSCTGTGTWEDGFVAPVVLELVMDVDGTSLISYGLQ